MKIVFLCGSLEPGCDGVGDYTRRLAGELIRQGHQTAIVALNDTFITEESIELQHEEEMKIPVLRLPSANFKKKCFEKVNEYITIYNPDWLSLQYVPFSYQIKGLLFGFSKLLKKISGERRWHIMFHELWVGMDEQASMKHFWWGQAQRQLIKSLIKNIKPCIIHTQTRLYQVQLKRLGYHATYLPLFGNIPLFNDSEVCNISHVNNRKIVLVIFGTIHPGAPVVSFVEELAFFSKEHQLKISFKMVGRCGQEQETWFAILRANGFDVEVLGELPSKRISQILSTASIGVSTTPYALIEKSGSVAAMREHNLPVICVARSWQLRSKVNVDWPAGVLEYNNGNLKSILNSELRFTSSHNISDVSLQFVKTLSGTM
jgi:hypothetical protein